MSIFHPHFVSKSRLWTTLSVLVSIGLNSPVSAVSHGHAVSPDDPIGPLTVSIYGSDDDCTGVKIAANLILTARHCALDKSTRVIFWDGSSHKIVDRLVPSRKRLVGKNQHDLAILKIDLSVPGPVAQIADDSTTPTNGSTAWIAGYGGRKPTKANNPLRKIEVEMTDRDYSPSAVTVHARNGGVICDGDSGGPGYTQTDGNVVVWGIDSAPLDGASTCTSWEVYAKVASEHDWIEKIIADNQLPGSPVSPTVTAATPQ
jgi:hypothetical protein